MKRHRSQSSKLTRPSAAGLIRRERVLGKLDAAGPGRLVWIAAHAGAGKTSLVSDWVESRGRHALWYRVDEGDDDPSLLFRYLRHAVRDRMRRVELPPWMDEELLNPASFARRFF